MNVQSDSKNDNKGAIKTHECITYYQFQLKKIMSIQKLKMNK
jgi:hypothetical protein